MTQEEQSILEEKGREANRQPYDRHGSKNPFWGKQHSEETKQKIRIAKIGTKTKPCSEERKRKISAANKGRKRSPEFKKHMSEIQKNGKAHFQGKHHSEETKKKLRETRMGENSPNWKGRACYPETREKMSKAKKGKKLSEGHIHNIIRGKTGKPLTELHRKHLGDAKRGENHPFWGKFLPKETRAKIGLANKGRKASDETKRKISLSMIGSKRHCKPHTPETKKKISETMMGRKLKPLTEETKKKIREAVLEYLGSDRKKYKENPLEMVIEGELRRLGIEYKRQASIEGIANVDFLLPGKVIMQCDGDYWHGKQRPKQCEKDAAQDLQLYFKGYKVFRFREKEIKKSARSCVAKALKWRNKNAS